MTEDLETDIKFHALSSIELAKDEYGEFERTSDGKLILSGWSVHTGKYHDGTVEILGSELKNIAKTLVNQQIRKNHGKQTEDVVGLITKTKTGLDQSRGKRGVKYKGVIRDEQLDSQITDGFIRHNSIGFTLTPICSKCGEDIRECSHYPGQDNVWIVAKDCECYEQSFVTHPADAGTTIEPGVNFEEIEKEKFINQFSKKNQEKDHMVDPKKTEPQEVPPININFSGLPDGDGDTKMSEEITELQEEIENLKVEFEEKLSEKEEKIDELTGEKIILEEEKTDLAEENEEIKEKLQEYVDAEQAKIDETKTQLCKDITELQVKCKKLDAEKADERAKELFDKYDVEALEEIKDMIIIPESSGKGPGKFHAQESGAAMPQENEEEIDFSDKKARDGLYRAMINSAKS